MKAMIFGVGLLAFPCLLCAQASQPSSNGEAESLLRPDFILHDASRRSQQSHSVLGPMSNDGKGATTGTIAFYGGDNLIQVTSLSFSGDGKLLAVGSTPGLVDLWEVEKKQKLRSFSGGTSVALSSDGSLLAKDGNGIEIVSVASGELLKRIKWSGGTIRRLSFDPSFQSLLVTANGEDDKIFDVKTGQKLAELRNTQQARFSADGLRVVGGNAKHLITWDTKSWKAISDLPNGPEYVTTIAAEPEKDLVVVGGPNTARLIKLSSGENAAEVGTGYTNFAALSKAGDRVFTYTAKGFAVWSTAGKQFCFVPDMGNGTMALSANDRWLAGAPVNHANDVMIWDVSQVLKKCSAVE